MIDTDKQLKRGNYQDARNGRRLVRFTAVSIDDDLAGEQDELLVFDTFIDAEGRVVNDEEMSGYQQYGAGTAGETRTEKLRLQPDLTFLHEETVIDGATLKDRQITHSSSLSDEIRIRPGFEFKVFVDDEYHYRIQEIHDLQPSTQT